MIPDILQPCERCDLREVLQFIHRLDTRVSVLETRMSGQDDRLEQIDNAVRETQHVINQLSQTLSNHAAQEDRSRITLLMRLNWTLISVLGSVMGYIGVQVYEKIFP